MKNKPEFTELELKGMTFFSSYNEALSYAKKTNQKIFINNSNFYIY